MRLQSLQEIYEDPLGAVADRMGEVHRLLAAGKSGDLTQDKQREIARVLEDLIKTAEEQSSSQQQQQDPSQGQGQKQDQGQGQQPGAGRRPAVAGGQPGGQPSRPAERSMLPPGPVRRPSDLADVRPTAGEDTWSRLPPEVRQRAEEEMERLLSEQYRGLIRDYRRYLSGSREEE